MSRRSAFTLVELLVVIAIIGVLVAVIAGGASRSGCCSAHPVRQQYAQIGLAIQQYADAHKGRFPAIAHDHAATESWIYSLAPYMESVDAIRLCPEDRARIEQDSGRVTSYAMNGYLREPDISPTGPEPGFVSKFSKLLDTHRTIVVFEAGKRPEDDPQKVDKVEVNFDHVESPEWFSEYNLKPARNKPPERRRVERSDRRSPRRSPSRRPRELSLCRRTRRHDLGRSNRRVVR